jgi:hypothetical protein
MWSATVQAINHQAAEGITSNAPVEMKISGYIPSSKDKVYNATVVSDNLKNSVYVKYGLTTDKSKIHLIIKYNYSGGYVVGFFKELICYTNITANTLQLLSEENNYKCFYANNTNDFVELLEIPVAQFN